MASISSRDRKLLEQLVRDCIIYGLNEHESMAYMKKRAGGIPFSRSYYYVIKKRVSEKESSTLRQANRAHSSGFCPESFQLHQEYRIHPKDFISNTSR